MSGGSRLAHSIVPRNAGQSKDPAVVLHGLLGSSKNFNSWAKELSKRFGGERDVYCLDLRNHGISAASGNNNDMTYETMAADVFVTLKALNIPSCHIIGHSMGGKVAATCAKIAASTPTISSSILSLTMMDISPVTYQPYELADVISCIQQLRLISDRWQGLSRTELQTLVENTFPERAFAQFILSSIKQNLAPADPSIWSSWRWTFNLDAIEANVQNILDFPASFPVTPKLPTLLLKGSNSKFVKSQHIKMIQESFPLFTITSVRDASHWLHVEKPTETTEKIAQFVEQAHEYHIQEALQRSLPAMEDFPDVVVRASSSQTVANTAILSI